MPRKTTTYMTLTALISSLLLGIVPLAVPVYASETVLRLSPSSIEDESLTPSNNITLTVEILNVTNLYGYELKIFYNNSVLNATEAVRPSGHFLEPSDPTNQFVVKWEIKNDYNATHGRIWLSYTLLAPEPAKTGSGILAQITFHVIGVGQTPIAFRDTKLADNTGSPIPHTAKSSYFSNTAPPPPPPPPTANVTTVEFNPDTLNLGRVKGWVSAYIELPNGYQVSEINVSTVMLNETILVDLSAPVEIGDYDNDSISDLMVSFNRTELSEFIVSQGITTGNVSLTMTFQLNDKTPFQATQTIKVRMPGDTNADGEVDIIDLAFVGYCFGSNPGDPRWKDAADENEDGTIDVFDLISVLLNYGNTYP